MKIVKIKFVGFWKEFIPESDIIYQTLKKHYDVQISENADYIICSMFGTPYEYCKHPQIRIMYSGENYIPDFNFIDYGISAYPLVLGDRHCSFPGFMFSPNVAKLNNRPRNYDSEFLSCKKYFANFITSHDSEYGLRSEFFKKLCQYKRVESPGTFLNNRGNQETLGWLDGSKTDFQRTTKFTICFESTAHEGFITEKIADAFSSDTIPIYYGSSTVSEIFNKNAFINCNDYDNFDDVIKKVIELDTNDELYLKMLNEPIFVKDEYIKNKYNELEAFLLNIFEQPLDKAYRRSRVYEPKRIETDIVSAFAAKNELNNISLSKALNIAFDRIKYRINTLFRF